MNRSTYIRSWIITTIIGLTLTLGIFIMKEPLQLQPNFLMILFGVFMAYILTMSGLTIAFLLYNPAYKEAQKMARLNQIFYELIKKTVYLTDSYELYQTILDSAIEALPMAQKGCIMLLNPETNLLHFSAVKGYDFEVLKNTYLKLDQTYLYRESHGNVRDTVMIDDPFEYDRQHINAENMDGILEAGTENVMSTLSTPIFYDNRLYGMINVDSKYRHVYTNEDKEIIELFALEVVSVLKLFTSFEKVNYFMNHDVLTKSYNRKHFNEVLKANHFNCQTTDAPYSLISLDLNMLKETNDHFGHHVGDMLLIGFTKGFQHMLPEDGCFARYGGDEFMVLLPNFTSIEAETLMMKVNTFFDYQYVVHEDEHIPISFAYGIASYPEEHGDYQELIKIADHKMYEHKKKSHQRLKPS